jgi:hypothetical protein
MRPDSRRAPIGWQILLNVCEGGFDPADEGCVEPLDSIEGFIENGDG